MPQTPYYSPSESVFSEIVDGKKEIEADDEELIIRKILTFDEFKPKTVFRLREKLMDTERALQTYIPLAYFEDWDLLADDPDEFSRENVKFYKSSEGILSLQAKYAVIFAIVDHYVACQKEVLSCDVPLKMSKKFVLYLLNDRESIQEELNNALNENERLRKRVSELEIVPKIELPLPITPPQTLETPPKKEADFLSTPKEPVLFREKEPKKRKPKKESYYMRKKRERLESQTKPDTIEPERFDEEDDESTDEPDTEPVEPNENEPEIQGI